MNSSIEIMPQRVNIYDNRIFKAFCKFLDDNGISYEVQEEIDVPLMRFEFRINGSIIYVRDVDRTIALLDVCGVYYKLP